MSIESNEGTSRLLDLIACDAPGDLLDGVTASKVWDCIIAVKIHMNSKSGFYYRFYKTIPDDGIVVNGITFALSGLFYEPEITPKWVKLKNQWIAAHPRDQFAEKYSGEYSHQCFLETVVEISEKEMRESDKKRIEPRLPQLLARKSSTL